MVQSRRTLSVNITSVPSRLSGVGVGWGRGGDVSNGNVHLDLLHTGLLASLSFGQSQLWQIRAAFYVPKIVKKLLLCFLHFVTMCFSFSHRYYRRFFSCHYQ